MFIEDIEVEEQVCNGGCFMLVNLRTRKSGI